MIKKAKIRENNRRSLSALSSAFVEHNAFLKKFLRRFLSERQDIEDVVQEAYLRAYQTGQYQNIVQPKAFLFQIAKNLALTELNRKARQLTDYIEEIDSPTIPGIGPTLENELEARQHIALYCEAAASLPERRRKILLLRKVYGLPYQEIADRLDISVSAVEKHLLKGMLTCRAYVREREQNCIDGTTDSTVTAQSVSAGRKD